MQWAQFLSFFHGARYYYCIGNVSSTPCCSLRTAGCMERRNRSNIISGCPAKYWSGCDMYGSLRCANADGYCGGTSGTNTAGLSYWWVSEETNRLERRHSYCGVFGSCICRRPSAFLQPCSASSIKQTAHFKQVQYRWQNMRHKFELGMRSNMHLL